LQTCDAAGVDDGACALALHEWGSMFQAEKNAFHQHVEGRGKRKGGPADLN
jgi:hypothetical protein